jgi:hypothetical protein
MHQTARLSAKRFFEKHCGHYKDATVVDIGSQDVNGSIREVCPFSYFGVDFVKGKNVDLVLTDPYDIPLKSASADIVVSSSCFEHSEFFWLTFLEMVRITKDLIYICHPSKGKVHRYPVDCWRFYPDSGEALAKWARHNGYNVELIETYITDNNWGDNVCVYKRTL